MNSDIILLGRFGNETSRLILQSEGLYQFVVANDLSYRMGTDPTDPNKCVYVDPSDGPMLTIGSKVSDTETVTEIFISKYNEICIKTDKYGTSK